MPFVEVAGNVGTVPLPQMTNEVPNGKVGVTLGITVMDIVLFRPHWPPLGVKVYVPEF